MEGKGNRSSITNHGTFVINIIHNKNSLFINKNTLCTIYAAVCVHVSVHIWLCVCIRA